MPPSINEKALVIRRTKGLPSEKAEIHLPQEIIVNIISFVPDDTSAQKTYHAACLVSRHWHFAATSFLYHYPKISGRNYQAFVRKVCPSVNAHIQKSAVAGLVKVLDMSALVHDGSKSLTARLLGRLKNNLEQFVAPQRSFA
jgi:hypothetical protein